MKYQVYGDMMSGNCYKIKLLLQWLQIKHEWIHVDVLTRETHTEAFLALNPNAKIPVLVIENDAGKKEVLTESNAILNYFAEGSPYLPDSGLDRARVLQWQFFEQYSHEPYIAVARFINKYQCLPKEREEEYYSKQEGGHKALKVMEEQLATTPFLTGDNPTIADISLYAYTHVAHEGGFDLAPHPHIQSWLKRIEQVPGYVEME